MTPEASARLQHQSLARSLTDAERALASALEKAFGAGHHDFNNVAGLLEQEGVKRPSGSTGPWTAEVLEQELSAINASLDDAYIANGIGG